MPLQPIGSNRRLKRICIHEHHLLGVFATALRDFPAAVEMPKIHLPAGTELLAVSQDVMTKTFWFMLSHPSWEEVPLGHAIPEVEVYPKTEMVRFTRMEMAGVDEPMFVPVGG